MSKLVPRADYDDGSFALGDRVSFLYPGSTDYRITGTIVRVYFDGCSYHVEHEGERYFVRVGEDDVRRES